MRFRLALGACFLALASLSARAQAPATIGHQGVLTTSGGAPVADGTYSLTFRLYSASTGGTALWTETHSSVSVSSGVFSATLGSVAPLNISFEQPLWLSVSVNSGAELSPRVQLTAAPYSMTAKSVADNAITSSEVADGTIATADLADGSVTSAKISDGTIAAADIATSTLTAGKIASGQVVKSLNSLTDAVTLAAGSNVTITPSGNTLTIAASGGSGSTLDQAYDQGGAGTGRTITADAGAVDIQGAGGLTVAGNVGIGTTSPGNKLHIDLMGSSEEARIDKDVNWVGSGFTHLRLSDRTTPNKMLRIGYSGTGDFSLLQSQESGVGFKPLLLNPNGGNVGIGTTSPSTRLHLAENGETVRLQNSSSGNNEHFALSQWGNAAGVAGFIGTNVYIDGTGTRQRHNTAEQAWGMWLDTVNDFFRIDRTDAAGTEAELLRITSTGNVGIGTTSPGSHRLEVTRADASAGGGGEHIVASNGQSAGALSQAALGVDANGGYVQSLNSKPLALNPGGNNVGIGTTSPGQRLDVELVGLPASAGARKSNIEAYNPGDAILFGSTNLNFTGSLGALSGNGAPYLQFLAYHSNNGNASRATGGAGLYPGRILSDSGANDNVLEFQSGDQPGQDSEVTWTTRMAINQNGNVGIGTTTPDVRLDIVGDSNGALRIASSETDITDKRLNIIGPQYTNANGNFRVLGGLANASDNLVDLGGGYGGYDAATQIRFFTAPALNTDSGTQRMLIDGSGNLGIGTTSPTRKLDVSGDMNLTGTLYNTFATISGTGDTPGGYAGISAQGTNRALYLTAGSGTVWIDQSGNVGIGTGSPGERLDVETSNATVAAFNRTTGDGTIISIQQSGTEQGTISVSAGTVSYNAFTGSHLAWAEGPIDHGMLVSLTGINRRRQEDPMTEIVYGIIPTSAANNPRVLGAYLGPQESSRPLGFDNPHLVMAVGNGDMWVVGDGADVRIGDYLISSGISGHAMVDRGEYEIAHIVARAAEPVHWDDVRAQVTGRKHKKISVFFESFVHNHKAERLERRIAELERSVARLERMVAAPQMVVEE